ncbi:hypothetical protein U1Q18_046557 [Sarracenia purpurea var. burkii]
MISVNNWTTVEVSDEVGIESKDVITADAYNSQSVLWILPLRFHFELPQDGEWALKSPQRMKGCGSEETRFSNSSWVIFSSGGRYRLQNVIGVERNTLAATACKSV